MTDNRTMPAIMQVISSRHTGGAERIVIDLSSELARRCYPVVVVCPPKSWLISQLKGSGVHIETLRMKGLSGRLIGTRKLQSVIRKYNIGIIHTHLRLDSEFALPLARNLNIPSVCTMHNTGEELYCQLADHTIAVSNSVRLDIVKRGVPPDDITVAPAGIRLMSRNSEAGLQFRAENNFSQSDTLVGSVCRFVKAKGLDVLIRAVAECNSNVKLILTGYGKPKYESHLKRIAQELDISDRVLFTGKTNDPAAIISALDIFAVSSNKEGGPITMFEASLLGVPVIATPVGIVPDFIEPGKTGMIVPVGDSHSLAKAINHLAYNKAVALKMADAAKQVVLERHTLDSMVGSIEEVYSGRFGWNQ